MEQKTRMEEIREKGFDMFNAYGNRIKIANKNISDAILDLTSLKTNYLYQYYNKGVILQALVDKDIPVLREISNEFYISNGIYQTLCDYVANLYRYDWYIVPEIYNDKIKPEAIIKEFTKILNFLDNIHIKKFCEEVALKVVKNGAYYGYKIDGKDSLQIQELPVNYCRSRFSSGGKPVIEFAMKFFDEKFPDTQYRLKVLKMFPAEFSKGYMLYKQGKLQPDYLGDTRGWYLLDPEKTVRFRLTDDEAPFFINVIPSILDLDAAQDLDRRKQMQKLLKIVVQKLPRDKNGDLIFDLDEAADIHNTAVQMLSNAVGVDVITTFADVDTLDISDNNTATTMDDLEKVERTVFNNFGISQNLFNTDGNMSLEKSILNDESSIRSLLLDFHVFFDEITQKLSSNKKKYNFRFYMLETTQHNYKDLSKMYKEQVQIGYSKMLPQIALGHSQSAIINTAYFENEVLHLSEIMIPPLMSSTLSGEDILKSKNDSGEVGRPETPDDQKSDKTIANKESMS